MYGTGWVFLLFSSAPKPDPRPEASSDPSCNAKYLGSIETTERMVGLKRRCQCFSLSVMPWYVRVKDFEYHFCWK